MIEIDLSTIIPWLNNFMNMVIVDFSGDDPWVAMGIFMFKYQGWLLYIYIFIRYLVFPEYMFFIQNRWFAKNVQMVLLAIDVPKMNEQSVQAMENFFGHLLGAHSSFLWWDKYIDGAFQLSFSCELISIEGNIQFLIRTPKQFRNLVEAALYGQFPDAEITEVQDYVTNAPRYYPNATHDLAGVEMTLSNKNVYLPIRTYEKFEHRFAEVFADPLAGLLENLAQIGPGEQVWIQYLLKPLPVDWGREGGEKEINKIIGKVEKPKTSIITLVFDMFFSVLSGFAEQLIGPGGETSAVPEKKEEQFRMMNLTPGQKEQLESMERKIARLAFNVKIRFLYIYEKGIDNKALSWQGIIGAYKQWTDMNANGLKPDMKPTGTGSAYYVFINRRRNTRKNYIMGAYRGRNSVMGSVAKPLNTEELASLWHFPGMSVKAPFLKATAFKKAAAPVGLPMEAKIPLPSEIKSVETVMTEKNINLPTFDYDNDEFEKQFALDREGFAKSRPAREKRLKEIAQAETAKAESAQKAALAAEEEVQRAVVKPKKPQASANLLDTDFSADNETQSSAQIPQTPESAKETNDSDKTPGNLPFLD